MKIEGKLLTIYRSDLRYYIFYVIISIPFILFFYDTFNLNANIYSTENLVLGINPYYNQGLLVIGYTALPYNYFQTLLYNLDGFNVYLVVIASKLIALVFTIGSSLLIYRILLLKGISLKKAKTAMLAFLFSPFIIFVDYVWVQPEFYSIFFLLLGFYAIEKHNNLNGKFLELLVASFSLLIAGITFYFPLLLIPGYFIYVRGKIPKVKFLLALVVSGIVLLVPIVLFNLKTTFVSAITGSTIDIFPYSLISLFLKTPYQIGEIELIFEFIFLISALVIPLLLYRYKKSMFLSQIIILAIVFSFQITGLNPDTFTFLIPFIIIEYSLANRTSFSFLRLIILQMVLLPEYINIQFLNGPGYVTGFYYWIYFWYHQNVVFLASIPHRLLITQILNALMYVCIYLLIAYLFIIERHKTDHYIIENNHKPFKTQTHETLRSKLKKSRIAYLSLIVILILLISSIPLSLSHNTSTIRATDKLPMMFYVSIDPQNGQYIMQNKDTYCYFPQNNTLSFYQGSTLTSLYKNISNENYRMLGNLSFNVPGNLVHPQDIFEFQKSFAGITKTVNINQSTESLQTERQSIVNISKLSTNENLGCFFLAQGGTSIFQLNESSYLRSSLNYTDFIGKTVLFLIGVENFTNLNLPVFSLKSGSTSYVLYSDNSSFYFGPANTPVSSVTFSKFPTSHMQTIKKSEGSISASWNLVGISFLNNSSAVFTLNGIKTQINLSNNSVALSIGDPISGNNKSLFSSPASFFATLPYVFNVNSSSFRPALFYRYNDIINLLVVNNSTKIPFAINVTGNISNVSIGSLKIEDLKHFQYIIFGQIDYSIIPFNMQVSLIEIQKENQSLNYTPISLDYALLIPLSVFLIWAYDSSRIKDS